MNGTWKTTSGPGVAVVGVVVTGALAYAALRSFAAMLGDAVAVALTAVVAVAVGAGVTLLAVRVRERRRGRPAPAEHAAIAGAFAREHEIRGARQRQVTAAPQQAIENHHHGPEFHIYGAGGQDTAAALIRQALTAEPPP